MDALASCGEMKAGNFSFGTDLSADANEGRTSFSFEERPSCRFGLLVRRAIAVPYAVVVFADLLDGALGDGAVGEVVR